MEEKGKTPTAAHKRRARAAAGPLGTLLLAKALDLTTDEARQLRADAGGLYRDYGALGMVREVAAVAKDKLIDWLEAQR